MSTATHPFALATPAHRVLNGVAAGLAGGLVFGVLMQMMGMIPMVAMLVGSESVAVGWVVHLLISAIAGAVFALVLGKWAVKIVPALLLGAGYGILWWVGGALLVMPAALGMPVLQLGTTAWQSLMGHLLFGLVLGAAYAGLARRGTH